MPACALLHFSRGRQQLQPTVDSALFAKSSRHRQYHSTFQRRVLDARKIHGGALPRRRAVNRFSAGLHPPPAQPPPPLKQFHFIPPPATSSNQPPPPH